MTRSRSTTTIDNKLYNWIAKLNFQLNANNSWSSSISAAASTSGPINGTIGATQADPHGCSARVSTTRTTRSLHFVSKLADRRLQLDVIAGYHYDRSHQHAGRRW